MPQQQNLAQPRETAAPRRPYVQQAVAAGPARRAALADPPAPARPERQANLHALPQPKLQPFDGRPDAIVDWRAFSSQFTRIANRFQWTDEEKLDRLVESLRDQALVFFSRLEEVDQNDYGRLCIQLGTIMAWNIKQEELKKQGMRDKDIANIAMQIVISLCINN